MGISVGTERERCGEEVTLQVKIGEGNEFHYDFSVEKVLRKGLVGPGDIGGIGLSHGCV